MGVQILAISMSTPEMLTRYLTETPLPFPLLADPTRVSYRAFGLERTTWLKIFRPRLIWKYLKLIAKGGKVRRVPEGEDALQLGGDFLVDRERRLVWVYLSSDPADRPSVNVLVAEAGKFFDSDR